MNMTATRIKARRVTDKELGFTYTVTSFGERVHPKLKRFLSPAGDKWSAFTYNHRLDKEYTLAHKKPLTTAQAMHWLAGNDKPLKGKPAPVYELNSQLTKRELAALRSILTSEAVPNTSTALSVQTVLLAAIDAI